MNVAVIGLGTMGGPMAANLLKAGVAVTVHNRSRDKEAEYASQGATRAQSPKDAAAGSELILTCVSDTPDAKAVILDSNDGVIAGASAGSLVVDCSTISPQGARDIAEELATRNVGFLDAPVSGGSEGAIAGTLAIMCGGTEQDFQRALPTLNVIGGAVTHVGPIGCGQIAKAVNQVIISGTYQSVAEGMALAHRAGADPEKVTEAIQNGAAASWILSNRARNMREDEYPLGFRLRLHRKDLGIALETARQEGLPLPMASYVATVEDGLIRQGHGDEDMSAIARTVRRNGGIAEGPMRSD